MNMKLVVGLFALLLVIVLGGKFAMDYAAGNATLPFFEKTAKATTHNQTFKLTVAKTEKEKEEGLSVKKSIAQDGGMLFDFDKPGIYSFWMKSMKFPIDILFIKDDKIVNIYQNVPAPKSDTDQLPVYSPTQEINKVVEINAGLSSKYGIKEGDTITIKE